MSASLMTRRCDICEQDKPCSAVSFHPVGDGSKAAPSPYTGTAGPAVMNEFYLSCCEDCGREKGTVSKTPWILILIGYVLMIGGIALISNVSGGDIWPIIPLMGGWMLTVFAPMALIFKLRSEASNGAMIGLLCLQFFPVVGLIALLCNLPRFNRCCRAVSALRPVADQRMQQAKAKDEEMTRLAESGAQLTEEQAKQLEEHQKEKESQEKANEYAREEQQQRVNRSNYRGAIFGIIFTIILAFIGLTTYSSGRGYMTFFGIELSPGAFAALIAAFIIWDIFSIVSAKKKM